MFLRAGLSGAAADRGAVDVRPLTAGMRRLFVVAGLLVLGTGLILTVFAERTGERFAWAIAPPLTAAFLGAGYLSSFAFQITAARQRHWAAARVAVPTTLTFTTLTTLATFLHFDRFNVDAPEAQAVAVTWAWIAVYVGVPPVMALLVLRQLRLPGGDPPRRERLPRAFRWVLGAQSAVMLGIGTALFAAPAEAAGIWPWELTPLTGRAVGAWLIGLSVGGVHSLLEDDWARVKPTAVGNLGLGTLYAVALARFGGDVDWERPHGYVYVAFVGSMLAVGAYASRRAARAPAA